MMTFEQYDLFFRQLKPQFSNLGTRTMRNAEIREHIEARTLLPSKTAAAEYSALKPEYKLTPNDKLGVKAMIGWRGKEYRDRWYATTDDNGDLTESYGPLLRIEDGDIFWYQGDHFTTADGLIVQGPTKTNPVGTSLVPWGPQGHLFKQWLQKIRTRKLRKNEITEEDLIKRIGKREFNKLVKLRDLSYPGGVTKR